MVDGCENVSTDLAGVVIFGVEQVAELRQELGPRLQLPFGGDGCDQDTCVEGDTIRRLYQHGTIL